MNPMQPEGGIVVIGDAQVTMVADGPIGEASTFRSGHSGDGLLTATVAARLGHPVAFVTRVGTDAFTREMLERWDGEGLHLDYARQVVGRNNVAFIGGGEAARIRDGAAAGLDTDDVAAILWQATHMVFAPGSTSALGPQPQQALVAAFTAARERGVKTIYDPTLHRGVWPEGAPQAPRAAFDELLPLIDLLVLSAPFATGQLLQRANATEAASVAQRRGLSQVVIRQGRRGCVVVDREQVITLEAPTTDAARTSPLGEAVFDGALMSALMDGQPLADAASAALRCTDVLVDAPDTVENLPPARALKAAMAGEASEVPPAP